VLPCHGLPMISHAALSQASASRHGAAGSRSAAGPAGRGVPSADEFSFNRYRIRGATYLMLVLQLLNCFPLLLIHFPLLLTKLGVHHPLGAAEEGSFKRRETLLHPEAEVAGVTMKYQPPDEYGHKCDKCRRHQEDDTVPDGEGQTVLLNS